ncbi:PadR family transcriptional regulator [Phytoactinopolyspora mesophila]|uniref:PadR family transcriptional regulator n=1 Tax=Phytoactinopolyspora mesophila TaxID=2650750 RepID=A0A7K3LYG4_9ACTN|nr:PadR family transcriptional regulator [Phytoactinopolyspora mesophila]NDL56049.1 PadR family transcriptional regulator [Phytoactinopolyspora mesophila]
MSKAGTKRRPVSNLLGLAVLGLLHERPMHPHAVAAELRERSLDRSFKVRTGSLYDVVAALERAGWIEAREKVQVGSRPERTVYGPTDAGRAALIDWVDELVRFPAEEFPAFVSAVTYLGVLEPADATSALRQRAERLRGVVEQLRDEHQAALAELDAEGKPRLFVLEAEYALHMHEAEVAWIEKTIAEIESGALSWPG